MSMIFCAPLLPMQMKLIFTSPAYSRAESPERLASLAQDAGFANVHVSLTVKDAVALAKDPAGSAFKRYSSGNSHKRLLLYSRRGTARDGGKFDTRHAERDEMKRHLMKRERGLSLQSGTRLSLGMLASLFLMTGSASGNTITSDKLEYFKEEQRYVATGNVQIVKDSTVVKSDEAVYFSETGDAYLTGHVSIDDKDYLINTEEAEFNLDDKYG